MSAALSDHDGDPNWAPSTAHLLQTQVEATLETRDGRTRWTSQGFRAQGEGIAGSWCTKKTPDRTPRSGNEREIPSLDDARVESESGHWKIPTCYVSAAPTCRAMLEVGISCKGLGGSSCGGTAADQSRLGCCTGLLRPCARRCMQSTPSARGRCEKAAPAARRRIPDIFLQARSLRRAFKQPKGRKRCWRPPVCLGHGVKGGGRA